MLNLHDLLAGCRRLAGVGSLLFTCCAGAAEPPVGIVIEVAGKIEPPLSAMTEISAGQPVHLAPGANLTFLHYARCRLVTVSGGTLTLTRSQFRTDGRVDSDAEGPCPRVYVPQGPAQTDRTTGGLLLRGGEAPPR